MSNRNRIIGTSEPKKPRKRIDGDFGVSRDYKAKVAALDYNTSSHIYIYGTGGNYGDLPNTLISTVDDSGTASSCIKRMQDFTFADGFLNEQTAKLKVNEKQTANHLLSEICNYISYFDNAFVLRILFNNAGEPSYIYHEQLEAFRKRDDGMFIYNRYMGTKIYKKGEDILIPPYDPLKSSEERVQQVKVQTDKHGKQLGEVLYIMDKGAGFLKDIYPVPNYYSGLDDIESDAAISRLEKRNIIKGWKAKMVISTGIIDDTTEDANGKTEHDYFAENIKNFSKPDGSDIVHLMGKTKEDKPEVTKLDVADILDGTDKATDRVGRKVCRHMGVPPVLIGFEETTIIGNSQAMANAIALFKRDIIYKQRIIKDTLTMLFPLIDWAISKLDIFSYIPPEVYAKMTDDEIRALGGLQPLPDKTSEESDIVINAINSLSPLVANKVLESMTAAEIRALVGLKTGTNIIQPDA